MIIKILSSTGTFAGVRYNTNKIENESGELMKIGNMPHVDNLDISEQACKDYLIAHSRVNRKTKNAQFHAVISANGKELSKYQLTEIAEKYLRKMGYGNNPYIIVFHSDTANNHVHIVSSRVGNDGKKISDSNEKFRTNKIRKKLMKEYDIKSKEDLNTLLTYSYQNAKQLEHLLKSQGYIVSEKENSFYIYYNGELNKTLNKHNIQGVKVDQKRTTQLKALINKYNFEYSSRLYPVFEKLKGDRLGDLLGYRSDLGDFLKSKFGIEMIYHFSGKQQPFGYTLIDHNQRNVFKGSDIIRLSLILNNSPDSKQKEKQKILNTVMSKVNAFNINNVGHVQILAKYYKVPEYQISLNNTILTDEDKFYYKTLIDHHLNYDNWSNISKLNIVPISHEGELYLIDKSNLLLIKAETCLDRWSIERYYQETTYNQPLLIEKEGIPEFIDFGWEIAEDEDDELIHRSKRNKRGKK